MEEPFPVITYACIRHGGELQPAGFASRHTAGPGLPPAYARCACGKALAIYRDGVEVHRNALGTLT